jgi:hypothetical protein
VWLGEEATLNLTRMIKGVNMYRLGVGKGNILGIFQESARMLVWLKYSNSKLETKKTHRRREMGM